MRKIFMLIFLIFFSCSTNKQNIKEASEVAISNNEPPAKVIADKVALNSDKLTNRRIAVADFSDIEGNSTAEGNLLSEQVITYLAQKSNLSVVERSKMNQILDEQKLTMMGLTESDNAQKVGKILNVDGIVSGTIAHLDGKVEINARLINVTTGVILCAVSVQGDEEENLKGTEHFSTEQREQIKKESAQREKERKKHPGLYKIKNKYRKQLIRLRKENSRLYLRVVKNIRAIEKLRREKPRIFLLVTEPQNSKKLRILKRRNPKAFKKTLKSRKKVKLILDNIPEYRKKLIYDRKMIIRNS